MRIKTLYDTSNSVLALAVKMTSYILYFAFNFTTYAAFILQSIKSDMNLER